MTVILVVCIVALVLVIGIAIRSRRSADAVADFRRQIDALSPQARRDVADQVRRINKADHDGEGKGDTDGA